MVMRIYAVLLALVCACSFNERDFGGRLCTGAEQCPRPDQDCIENTCTQKSCSNDLDCGASHDFTCASGVCVVDACTDTDCELGYACAEGFCQASFNVVSVASTSNTSIAITFDSPPDATTATVLQNYVVDGLDVSGTPSLSGTTVTLTTTPQTQTSYKVTVSGVTRDFDKASLIVDEGTFTGRNPFKVASAISASAITVAITFTEPPDPATALNLANYSVSGLTVTGTPTILGNVVTVRTSSQSQSPYTVTVTNVRRAADAEALTTGVAMFTGRNDFNIASAIPKTTTTIEVAFDALPQSASANTASNYTIPGLTVSSALLRTSDNTVVLTLAGPQSGAMYTVTVANILRASDTEALTVNNASFMGRTPFNVADVVPKTSTSIEVTFDGPPNAAQATILSNYSIPTLTLIGTPVLAGNVVTLTTAPQNAQLYNVTVNNVTRTDGEALTEKVATFTGRDPFNVMVASAISTTRVDVTFDAAPNPGQATQLTNYTINNGLTVLSATLAGNTVVLTTSPQAGMTTYTVAVTNVSRAADAELLTNAMANFAGRAPFNVMNVMTPSSTSIAVVFDAPPNASQAQTLSNYSVPGLTLSGTPSLAGSTVTITTAPQLAQNYNLSVVNVTRSADAEGLTTNAYQFMGRPRFNVMSAASTSNVQMTVTFDAPPNPTQATTLANYSVPGLTLTGTPTLSGNTVTITTGSQTGGTNYTVTVNNVTRNTDTEPLFVKTANFTGRAGFNVTSAASKNTTQITVTFDAPPNAAQAQTLANYSVPGLTLSGTPALAGNTVTITTSPQSAGQYTVTVANVTRDSDTSPLVINSAQFTYVSFNVASATAITNRLISVTFDAPPTPAQATNLANYTVPGLTLNGTPTLAGSTVTIQTSSQLPQNYTVSVANVTRASDGSTLSNTTANFLGRAAFNVTTVVAQTSGSIQVTFSDPPNVAAATTLTNYSVVGLTLMGTPVLNGNTVTIQTMIQTATMYTLTINNVTRASDAEPLPTNMFTFMGKAQTAPTITAVTVQATVPNNGTTFYNTGKATLVITGTEFTGVQCAGVTLDDRNGVGVQINTPAETCTVNTATQITATFPAGIRTNGTTGWSVRVTNGVDTGISTAKVVVKAGLLISEVMIGQNGGESTHEFFELYNPTANSINVTNLGLVVHVRNGTTDSVLPTNVVSGRRTIASHGFMLFTTTASSADTWWGNRDQTYEAPPITGGLELDGNDGLYLSLSTNPQVMVLDKLGWGTQAAEGREGVATANLSPNQSVQRKPAGGGGAATDTDDNLTDFNGQTTSITPKGTQQPSEP